MEKIEKAKNAQLARESELALPVELTREQNISLVREYVKRHFVAAGMCADICLHDTGGGNPHAHIMLTIRPFEQDGGWGAKQKKEYILKDASKILNFLTDNNIMDMARLDEHFSGMIGRQMDIGDKLKPIERRLPVLKKYLEQYDIYLKFKGKKALSEADKILFREAHSHLKGVMNGHSSLPVTAWKSEYAKLTSEQKALNQRYLALKNEVKEAEQIRGSVYSILRQEQREQQLHKAQEVGR